MGVQDGWYGFDNDLNSVINALKGNYVYSGLGVTEQDPQAMGVTVAAGTYYAFGVRTVNASPTNVSIAAADPDNPRKDLIVGDGITISAITGTPEAALPSGNTGPETYKPASPDIPANNTILAEVWVGAGVTVIVNANITPRAIVLGSAYIIENIPGGGISAATVQAAINELDSEKTNKATLTEQGDIYYASAAATPAALAHGDAGNLLQSGGHGANPSWVDHVGDGDPHTPYLLASGARAFSGNLLPSIKDALNIGSMDFGLFRIYLGAAGWLYFGTDTALFRAGVFPETALASANHFQISQGKEFRPGGDAGSAFGEDGSGNAYLKDAVTGTKTLHQLAIPHPLYDSGWVLCSTDANNLQTFTHNLGAKALLISIFAADDASGTDPTQYCWRTAVGADYWGTWVVNNGVNSLAIYQADYEVMAYHRVGATVKYYREGVDYMRVLIWATE